MRVLQSVLPQRRPGKALQQQAGCASREDSASQCDVALEHPSVAPLLVSVRDAKVHGAGDVRGAVTVLAPRITQVQGVLRDPPVLSLLGLVVDDGRVGAAGGDGREGVPDGTKLGTAHPTQHGSRAKLRKGGVWIFKGV